MARSRRRDPDGLLIREEFEALLTHYHHLKVEHQNASPGSGVRRRLEERLLDVRERFDRRLEEWVPEPSVRDQWRRYLDHHGPEPSGPPPVSPVVFRGRAETSGAIVEIRGRPDDREVRIDGVLVERIVGEKDFAATASRHRIRLDRTWYDEVFEASPQALEALARGLAEDGGPPWEHVTELLADGIVDVHVAVTPRGRRALAQVGTG
jgi:hypothetical protein